MDYTVPVPHGLLSMHKCKAIVALCMDFRYKDAALTLVKKQLGIETSDLAVPPGVIKFFVEGRQPFADYLVETVALALKLHQPEELILFPHSQCGAYGIPDANEEFAKQHADTLEARKKLRGLFPELRIRFFFAKGDQEKDEIVFSEVE